MGWLRFTTLRRDHGRSVATGFVSQFANVGSGPTSWNYRQLAKRLLVLLYYRRRIDIVVRGTGYPVPGRENPASNGVMRP